MNHTKDDTKRTVHLPGTNRTKAEETLLPTRKWEEYHGSLIHWQLRGFHKLVKI
jgi:hypothetical protein